MEFKLIDFNKYSSPVEVKDYELFIGPEGEYYKVKTRYESDQNCTHYVWAEKYLEEFGLSSLLTKEKITKKCKTPLEVLVHYCGFIRYTHMYGRNIYLNIPNKLYFGYILSKKQINSLYNLMDYNHDKVNDDIINQIERLDEEYDTKIDKVFEKFKR